MISRGVIDEVMVAGVNNKLLLIAAAFTGISGLCLLLTRELLELTAEDDHALDAQSDLGYANPADHE